MSANAAQLGIASFELLQLGSALRATSWISDADLSFVRGQRNVLSPTFIDAILGTVNLHNNDSLQFVIFNFQRCSE